MLARSVALNLAGQFGTLLVGFASSIVLARLLGPADRGMLAVVLSVADVLLVVVGIGLPMAVMYFASRETPPTGALLGNSFAHALLLAALLGPTFFFLREPLAEAFSRGEGTSVWPLLTVVVVANFLAWTTTNQLAGELRFGLFNALSVAGKAVTLVLVVCLIGLGGGGVAAAVAATAAGAATSAVGALVVLLRKARPALDRALYGSLVRYGARVQAGALFGSLNLRLDVLVLQFFRPLAAVGYYVIAQIVAELVIVLARAFQASVLPLVRRYEGDDRQLATTTAALRHHGLLAAVAVLVNAGFGTLVLLVGYGDEFRPALEPMLILLPGMWFLGTANVITGDLNGRGRPGLASALTGATVVLTVALDLLLIPPYGIVGAAIASVVAYVAYGVASLHALARVAGVPLRDLVVPTRDDLRAYPAALRAFRQRKSGRVRSTTDLHE
ncbi:MAG TPA: oligosaccharide flippase family protein [Gaiellaceae bacterium]|nr:oligosaccharide flippase family protein [Gaiellaceae bacterium]